MSAPCLRNVGCNLPSRTPVHRSVARRLAAPARAIAKEAMTEPVPGTVRQHNIEQLYFSSSWTAPSNRRCPCLGRRPSTLRPYPTLGPPSLFARDVPVQPDLVRLHSFAAPCRLAFAAITTNEIQASVSFSFSPPSLGTHLGSFTRDESLARCDRAVNAANARPL
jgi:hypothetical protein